MFAGRVSTHLPFSASSLSCEHPPPPPQLPTICIKRCINLHKLLHKWGNLKCKGVTQRGQQSRTQERRLDQSGHKRKVEGRRKEGGAARHMRAVCAQRVTIAIFPSQAALDLTLILLESHYFVHPIRADEIQVLPA